MRNISQITVGLCLGLIILTCIARGEEIGNPSNAASKSPYPPSPLIAGVDWQMQTRTQFGKGSDQWPLTWAGDGGLYAGWGDGWGWEKTDPKYSMGITRIGGTPPALTGANVWGLGLKPGIAKPEALLGVGDTLYLFWTKGRSKLDDDTWTAVSHNGGTSWTLGTAKFLPEAPAGFRVRGICQFGRGYEGAMDEYVYVYFGFNNKCELYLGRATVVDIFDAAKYQWFTGLSENGQAIWSARFADRKPVFNDPNGYVFHIGICYNPGLKRFLMTKPHRGAGYSTKTTAFGIFDAPAPWGPWTTAFYQDNFIDKLMKFSYFIPTKFISADGRNFWLAWSGYPEYDNVNFIKGALRLRK